MITNLLLSLNTPHYNMGTRRNFRGGGGASPKKAPHMGKNVAKRPPHGEKCLHKEKNVTRRPPYGEKVAKRPPYGKEVAKRPPYIENKCF